LLGAMRPTTSCFKSSHAQRLARHSNPGTRDAFAGCSSVGYVSKGVEASSSHRISILELLYQQHIYTPHRHQISHAPSAYFQSSLNCILPQTNIDPDSQFCTIPQTNISANHLATRPKCAPPVTQSLSTCKRAESLPRRVSNSTPTQPLTRPDLCSDNSCATA
jgi:hypothetical protein